MISFHSGSTPIMFKPEVIAVMVTTPRAVRSTLPRPPAIDVPPSAIAAIADSVRELPIVGTADFCLYAYRAPARELQAPLTTKAMICARSVSTPASLAERILAPTAKIARPEDVYC